MLFWLAVLAWFLGFCCASVAILIIGRRDPIGPSLLSVGFLWVYFAVWFFIGYLTVSFFPGPILPWWLLALIEVSVLCAGVGKIVHTIMLTVPELLGWNTADAVKPTQIYVPPPSPAPVAARPIEDFTWEEFWAWAKPYHLSSKPEIVYWLDASINGLTPAQVRERIKWPRLIALYNLLPYPPCGYSATPLALYPCTRPPLRGGRTALHSAPDSASVLGPARAVQPPLSPLSILFRREKTRSGTR